MVNALFLTFVWVIAVPIVMGLGLMKMFKKRNKNILEALIIGLYFGFAIFELFAVPFTFIKRSFYELRNTWLTIILTFTAISLIINRKELEKIYTDTIEEIKKLPKALTIVCLVLILFQCYMGFKYKHEDADDYTFVAQAVAAVDTNTLYKYNDLGVELKKFNWRNTLSPFFFYTASIATLAKVHPTVLAHTVFPVIFVLIAYSLYYIIGKYLFENDYEKVFTFFIILNVLHIFGNYTRYSIFVRLLTRAWQGKSILATISIPAIFYVFLKGIGEKNNNYYWFMLLLILWGTMLLSSMALSIPIIVAGLLTLLYVIKDKKISYIFKFILTIIPSVCYGIIYLFIK